ncbi:hypothetical protein WT88_29535 [Burkholderia stagnalis]|uniref:hypothetical protein n=1 Tax=Burkholderia stagnalis TaxID=1503054 RepID=UPI00075EBE3E|nr:hypothetical protein [Burkholderia stagnalis]KVZ18626.1 hypothetical protein WT35_04475 [Burkholderia stagnalis]KWN32849.1 hypothetical protein WT86_18600 [Burkholderia stagnalis]KWN44676.1 hypothetical protein WT88_29535 [Burkholderia stagnalis]KWN54409.1 hypothetical protein WT87_03630 [Burkholderia stagnalis]KWO68816.1 hypothetical protein WT99_21000 [Burkholderia stagnalis]
MSTAVYSGEIYRVPVSRCSETVRLAALAAGATVVEARSSVLRGEGLYVVDSDAGCAYRIMPDGSFRWFDPEHDDGDAFYLVKACKLSVEYSPDGHSVTVRAPIRPGLAWRAVVEPEARTCPVRHAIVKIAAFMQYDKGSA